MSWAEDIAPEGARTKLAAERAARRNLEANCALDFLVWGDTHASGAHAERCVHVAAGGEQCAREYDPLPYAEAAPADSRIYEGTGIAALYGIPGGEAHAWQLAGWNIGPNIRARRAAAERYMREGEDHPLARRAGGR